MIINGTHVANIKLDNLIHRISKLKIKGIIPKLGILLIGDNMDSIMYINMKQKKCIEYGIDVKVVHFPVDVNQEDIISIINDMNNNNTIHGILIQLPLPTNLNTHFIINSIHPLKDVDGLTYTSIGKISHNVNSYISSTSRGCIELLEYYKLLPYNEEFKVVIIGDSIHIGIPLSILFMKRGYNVQVCNKYTKNIKYITKEADLLLTACGVPHLIKSDWIQSNCILVDIGINKKGSNIVGDIDYDNVYNKCRAITPVPGGIGPMTIAILLTQLVESSERYYRSTISNL